MNLETARNLKVGDIVTLKKVIPDKSPDARITFGILNELLDKMSGSPAKVMDKLTGGGTVFCCCCIDGVDYDFHLPIDWLEEEYEAKEPQAEVPEDEKGAGGLWDLAAKIALAVASKRKAHMPYYAEEWGQEDIYNLLLEYATYEEGV